MDFDLAESRPTKLRERVEILLLIFLGREEKGVPRRAAIRIAKPTKLLGVLLEPGGDAFSADLNACFAKFWLVVIGDAKEYMNLVVQSRRLITITFAQI